MLLRLPSGSNRRTASRPRLGSSPGLGIALARTASYASSSNRPYSEPLKKDYRLREGEIVDEMGIADRPIYIIRTNGQPTGVRKIALIVNDRPGYFDATRNEVAMYKQIAAAHPESWTDHLIPYRESHSNRESIIIDFEWIDGVDVETYLREHPRAASTLFDLIARQLRWLAAAGYIHRDIKTSNFFRTTDGRVLILDLGTASNRINIMASQYEKRAFIDMIRPFVKESIVRRLDEQPADLSLPDFYLMAGRRLRKSARATRKRPHDKQRLHT